ncbi:hypothetical protein GCM10025882_16230 [Acinetobacter gyllenbergii]|uniref:Uncharacterized protein n=2 Tax=Moraxellaceae TaxID=468 RepID=A0A829HE97_9GAMM|nr:hypothetical protein [Acinetobacter gyllenbergii]EPF77503.1 hypothetical protein F957_02675 [Acinetobacter gyllenbergii CIP 110306 = MTCC 11365]EPH33330.1 hypothetical protein L293_0930 [Acinetobacter gyllenbergii CIP 110306 = MTCC 11365]OBY73688.1 hypothetical protein NG55_13610 [Acinetobacter gyllenbergii]GMA11198.1 hypothetical protein GCM10025882_16230 [Acinetobacter gyllenbergii]
MEEQVGKKAIGKVPYIAFFVGMLIMSILLIYSYTTTSVGGWGDLGRNIMVGLTLLVVAAYSLWFFLCALYLWVIYHKQPNVDVSPANWAMGLHASTVIFILLLFFSGS